MIALHELANILVHFEQCLTAEQRERFGVYVADGQEAHMAVMRCLSVLRGLDDQTGNQATYVAGGLEPDALQPVGYLYEYGDPSTGNSVWVYGNHAWNNRKPRRTRALYALPATEVSA